MLSQSQTGKPLTTFNANGETTMTTHNQDQQGFMHISAFYFKRPLVELLEDLLARAHIDKTDFYCVLEEINVRFSPKQRLLAKQMQQHQQIHTVDYHTWAQSQQTLTTKEFAATCAHTLDQHRCPLPLIVLQLAVAQLAAITTNLSLDLILEMPQEQQNFCHQLSVTLQQEFSHLVDSSYTVVELKTPQSPQLLRA